MGKVNLPLYSTLIDGYQLQLEYNPRVRCLPSSVGLLYRAQGLDIAWHEHADVYSPAT